MRDPDWPSANPATITLDQGRFKATDEAEDSPLIDLVGACAGAGIIVLDRLPAFQLNSTARAWRQGTNWKCCNYTQIIRRLELDDWVDEPQG